MTRIRGYIHVERALDRGSRRRDRWSGSRAALDDLNGLVGEVACEEEASCQIPVRVYANYDSLIMSWLTGLLTRSSS